jgi:nucleotide-binding universal stress UspA family protein
MRMYQKILLALDATSADKSLLAHIVELAKLHTSQLLLLHVADGWAARNYDALKLADSEEIKEDRAYLERIAAELRASGLDVSTQLAMGNPPTEILRTAAAQQCDLIAMTTHGHRFLMDILLGSTIEVVRHRTHIPLLIVRAE